MDWEPWLAGRPLAVIATADLEGLPHAVPVEVVVDAGRVYSWCDRRSVRVRNLRARPRAAVVAYKGNDFVLVRGSVRLLTARDGEYGRITGLFLQKYKRDEAFGNDTLVEVMPEQVTARI